MRDGGGGDGDGGDGDGGDGDGDGEGEGEGECERVSASACLLGSRRALAPWHGVPIVTRSILHSDARIEWSDAMRACMAHGVRSKLR